MKVTKLTEQIISEKEVKKLLSNIKTSNSRYNYDQFSKLFDSNMIWETIEGKALAAIVKNKLGLNDYYINEIQSFEKGYGAKLLKELIAKYNNIWLLADPDSGSKLVNYYKQFGLKEVNLKNSIWNKPITLFYNGDSELKNAIVKEYHN